MRIPFKKNSLILSIGPLLIVIFLFLLGWLFLDGLHRFGEDKESFAKQNKMASDILFLDEVLTNTARMAVLTGDSYWIHEYNKNLLILDENIASMSKSIDTEFYEDTIGKSEKSNALLVEMEKRALSLVKENHNQDAVAILFGEFYKEQKINFHQGISLALKIIDDQQYNLYEEAKHNFLIRFGVFLLLFLSVLIGWGLFLTKVYKNYYTERFSSLSILFNIRLKKLISILGDDLNRYISVCETSYKLMLQELRELKKLNWSLVEGMQNEDFENLDRSHIQHRDRVEYMITNMRKLSRIEIEEQEAVCIDVPIKKALITMKSIFESEGVKYSDSFPREKVYLFVNERLFTQVISELFVNALDSVRKTYRPKIRLEAKLVDNDLIIDVLDSGEEISKDAQPKIFDTFFTTKADEKKLGIGLSISRKIIGEFGGTLTYKYRNKSNVFTINIPVLKIAD